MNDHPSHVIRVGDMQVKRRKPGAAYETNEKPKGGAFSFSERLLRDCALCTAAMLCVMGLGNAQQPSAVMASQRLSQVVTTDLETEEILGQLQFVHHLLPQSVQVFWADSPGTVAIRAPSEGEVRHVWAISEPWTEYAGGESVHACASGEVMCVTPMDDGTFAVRIRHDDSLESIYSQLSECMVKEGDWIEAGGQLGHAADGLLFEIRKDGRAISPETLK